MPTGRIRCEPEAKFLGSVVEVQIDNASLNYGPTILPRDLDNPIHAGKGENNFAGTSDGSTCKATATTSSDDRSPRLVGNAKNVCDIVGTVSLHDTEGRSVADLTGFISLCLSESRRVNDDAFP